MGVAGLIGGLLVAAGLVGTTAGQPPTLRVQVTTGARPLAGASVRVGARGERTDRRGTVVFALEPGSHRVITVKIGWRPDTTMVRLEPTSDTVIVVTLERLAVPLEELAVSTTRTDRRIEDQALRVEVLETEEIEEKLLMTPGDVVMLLAETGGIRIQSTNPSLGGSAIRIQGLRGRHTQVLADGLPLFGERVGALGPLQIPPMDLGAVEILKGVASASFGGSALGGVINLISRRPVPGTSLLLNATTERGTDAAAFTGGALGTEWGYTVLAGYHAQPRRDRDRDGWTEMPGYRRGLARPRVFWSDPAGQSLLLTTGALRETRTGGTIEGSLAPDGAPFAERLETTRLDLGLVGRFRWSDRRWIAVRGSAMSLRHRHRFGSVLEPDRHRSFLVEATVTQPIGETEAVLGAALASDQYRSDLLPSMDFDFAVPALFLQLERSLGERVVLAASGRYDHHPRYGDFVSPRASALFRAGAGWTVRLSAGGGFFGPTPLTEETERVGLSRLLPPFGLVAERGLGFSLDLGGTLGPVELNLTGFATRVRHPLLVRPTATGDRIELVNGTGPARSRGADFLVRFRQRGFGVTASYAFVDATEPDPSGPGRRTVPLTPRHAAGLVATWEAEGRARVGFEAYYTGRQALDHDPYRERSVPYLVTGVLGEYRMGRARLFLNLENLTGVRQADFSPLVRPSRAPDGRWTTDGWAPLEGRVVNGGVRVAW